MVSEMEAKPEGSKDYARANFGKAWQDRINTLYSKAYEMWRVCLHNDRSGNSAVLVQDDNGHWHVFMSEENMRWPINFAEIPGASVKYIRDIRTEADGQMDLYYQKKHGRIQPLPLTWPQQQHEKQADAGGDGSERHARSTEHAASVVLPEATNEAESLWHISDDNVDDERQADQGTPPPGNAGDSDLFSQAYLSDASPSHYAPVAPMFERLQSGAESAWTLASSTDAASGSTTQGMSFAQPADAQDTPRMHNRMSTPRQQSPPISNGVASPSPSYRVNKRAREPFFRRHSRVNRGGRTTVE